MQSKYNIGDVFYAHGRVWEIIEVFESLTKENIGYLVNNLLVTKDSDVMEIFYEDELNTDIIIDFHLKNGNEVRNRISTYRLLAKNKVHMPVYKMDYHDFNALINLNFKRSYDFAFHRHFCHLNGKYSYKYLIRDDKNFIKDAPLYIKDWEENKEETVLPIYLLYELYNRSLLQQCYFIVEGEQS